MGIFFLFKVAVCIACWKFLVVEKPHVHIKLARGFKYKAEIVPPLILTKILIRTAFGTKFLYSAVFNCQNLLTQAFLGLAV